MEDHGLTPPETTESTIRDMTIDRAVEYLNQLQSQIDALTAKNIAQRIRIRKLEVDRETLRGRLEAARQTRSRFSRTPSDTPPQATPIDSATETPGEIPSPRLQFRVAAIVDQFTQQTFGPEWSMLNLRRQTWRADLENFEPEMFFVESAFAGSGGDWSGELARFGSSSETLREVVAWCNTHNVPTVFWNKEDPINFEIFIETARLFDFIFTVDSDSIDRYQRHVPGATIELLPFAAQPAMHYPPATLEDRIHDVAFAGGYYAAKLPERRAQMELIIDPARKFSLDIFDRFANTDSRFLWPPKYRPHIRGSLSYSDTLDVYRQYKVSLNVNSVTTSSTMCSRRIFELLACGAYIVSGPSAAIGTYVPAGLVHVAWSAEESDQLIQRGLSDRSVLEAAATLGPEWISTGQTYADRVDHILDFVGLS